MDNRLKEAHEIVEYIHQAKKRTGVKAYIKTAISPVNLEDCQIFRGGDHFLVIGEYQPIKAFLETYASEIEDYYIENTSRNSAVPLLDLKEINARIEPGAIIREKVKIGNQAVILMGAVINIGAEIGEGTMIDMNAVVGGRALIGKNVHVGAGAVIAGVIEPPSKQPVMIEDDVMIGANAVVLEGVRVGKGAVVAAGAVVTEDVAANAVVAGMPAKFIKYRDQQTSEKTQMMEGLRK